MEDTITFSVSLILLPGFLIAYILSLVRPLCAA